MIVADHRERRSGIPESLERLGVRVWTRDLGAVDYVVSDRLAVVRKTERDLQPWQALGRFHECLVRAREQFAVVLVLVLPAAERAPAEVRRGAIARAIRRGVSVLEARDPDDAARWIARIADQEQRTTADPRLPGRRKASDPGRLAEAIVADLPGVGPVGARRLLEHLGSVGAVMSASVDEIDAVPGFGRRRAEAIASVTQAPYQSAATASAR